MDRFEGDVRVDRDVGADRDCLRIDEEAPRMADPRSWAECRELLRERIAGTDLQQAVRGGECSRRCALRHRPDPWSHRIRIRAARQPAAALAVSVSDSWTSPGTTRSWRTLTRRRAPTSFA